MRQIFSALFRRRAAQPCQAVTDNAIAAPVIADDTGLSADQVHALFTQLLEEQRALAAAHYADPYWTDSRTGRNVSVDERAAIRMIETIPATPTADHYAQPAAYARFLLRELDHVAERYRAVAEDPDGYGIATIGTIRRVLQQHLALGG